MKLTSNMYISNNDSETDYILEHGEFQELWEKLGEEVLKGLSRANERSWVNISISDGKECYQFMWVIGTEKNI